MNSMTGFGQGDAEGADVRVTVVLRGVNHRFLDVSLRLPEGARASEAAVQRRIGGVVERGRVEVTAEIVATSPVKPRVDVDRAAARALAEVAAELEAAGVASGLPATGDLLRMPEIVQVHEASVEWSEAVEGTLLAATDRALEALVVSRREEGRRLADVVSEKLDGLESLTSDLDELRPRVQAALRESLAARLAELAGEAGVDPDRFDQEAALLIDRSNISEELERLRVHLEHLRQVLGESGAVGKRADFLIQEIFRELNTLSTKCRSSEMTRLCVDGKVLCEEIREQLRNVE